MRQAQESDATRETGRLEAFSDGVFAIAITLLILDLKVPPADQLGPGGLWVTLAREWPEMAALALSFVTVLVMWVNHHRLFAHIRRVDGRFMYLNGFLLFLATFIPFPTSLVAEYIRTPEAKVAVLVYAATNVCLAVAYQLLWRYASGNGRLLRPDFSGEQVDRINRQYAFGLPLYVVALASAAVNADLAMGLITFLTMYYAVTSYLSTE